MTSIPAVRGKGVDSTYSLDICPRCEEGILATVEVPHDVTLAGSVVRIARVRAEECRHCGYRALSGREVRLFEVLFAPQYARIAELAAALRAARYTGMFLREDEADTRLGFSAREYVTTLLGELRELYLDNESMHVLEGLSGDSPLVPVDLGGHRCTVRLPKIGEGENGVVYDFEEAPGQVFKVAKPRPYSRDHLRRECEVAEFFAGHGVRVPMIVEHDRFGSFVIKERLDGESLAVLYPRLGPPESPRHRRVRATVQAFVEGLLELFERHPEVKTSVSPNNVFIVERGEECRCLLVDTGPAPFHDYSRFDFAVYWEVTIPRKIEQYRAVGYI